MTEPEKLFGSIEAIEESLGLPRGILLMLKNEGDDWSFVIKSHALLESALNHALVATYKAPEAADIFARLDTSNATTGKLAFIKARDLLAKPHRTFIHTFSTLRNDLVHDVSNVMFTFTTHFAKMDPKERATFEKNIRAIFANADAESRFRVQGQSAYGHLGIRFRGCGPMPHYESEVRA